MTGARSAFTLHRHWRLIILAVAVLAAYAPSLLGGFVYDDPRFVPENPAVTNLDFTNAIRYFTVPETAAGEGGEGIYRPLRTLDFAIDWALFGNRPLFFHLRSVLYHLLGAMLVLAVLGRLFEKEKQGGDCAFLGALLYALHPVQTENVAWISSRGDLLLLCLFLLALLMHMRGRVLAAALLLVAALLAKESAVVFAGAAILADRFRRAPLRWRTYALYAGMGVAYTLFWSQHVGGDTREGLGQVTLWWGGSYEANFITAIKGFVYDAKLLLLPTGLLVDYHVPARADDVGALVSLVLFGGLVWAALAGGRGSRFALFWFLVTILPVSNLLFPMLVPTAERFLLLPSIGLVVWAAPLLARTRWRWAIYACFFVLTFLRCFDWKNNRTLWAATLREADTPISLHLHVDDLMERMEESGAPEDALRVVEAADRHDRLYREDILFAPPPQNAGPVIEAKARALLLLGNYSRANDFCRKAFNDYGVVRAAYWASFAHEKAGEFGQAWVALERYLKAVGSPVDSPDFPRPDPARHGNLALGAGNEYLKSGRREEALSAFARVIEIHPDASTREQVHRLLEKLR